MTKKITYLLFLIAIIACENNNNITSHSFNPTSKTPKITGLWQATSQGIIFNLDTLGKVNMICLPCKNLKDSLELNELSTKPYKGTFNINKSKISTNFDSISVNLSYFKDSLMALFDVPNRKLDTVYFNRAETYSNFQDVKKTVKKWGNQKLIMQDINNGDRFNSFKFKNDTLYSMSYEDTSYNYKIYDFLGKAVLIFYSPRSAYISRSSVVGFNITHVNGSLLHGFEFSVSPRNFEASEIPCLWQIGPWPKTH